MSRTPIHPGEILGDELRELGVTHEGLGRDLGVSGSTINRIVTGKQAIIAEMALRLGHWFGTTPRFWVNLQTQYDLRLAEGLNRRDRKILADATGCLTKPFC